MLMVAYSGLAELSCALTASRIRCMRSVMTDWCRMYVLDSSCHFRAGHGINLIATPFLSGGPTMMFDNSYSTLDVIEIGLIETGGHRRKGI